MSLVLMTKVVLSKRAAIANVMLDGKVTESHVLMLMSAMSMILMIFITNVKISLPHVTTQTVHMSVGVMKASKSILLTVLPV